jgi:hypothetical protein
MVGINGVSIKPPQPLPGRDPALHPETYMTIEVSGLPTGASAYLNSASNL